MKALTFLSNIFILTDITIAHITESGITMPVCNDPMRELRNLPFIHVSLPYGGNVQNLLLSPKYSPIVVICSSPTLLEDIQNHSSCPLVPINHAVPVASTHPPTFIPAKPQYCYLVSSIDRSLLPILVLPSVSFYIVDRVCVVSMTFTVELRLASTSF